MNKGFPFASNEMEEREQKALGEDNQKIIDLAIRYMAEGDAEALGKLMVGAQTLFDQAVAPMCPEELTSPKLHEVLADPIIKQWTYGGMRNGNAGNCCTDSWMALMPFSGKA